jgi:hypothetical protein
MSLPPTTLVQEGDRHPDLALDGHIHSWHPGDYQWDDGRMAAAGVRPTHATTWCQASTDSRLGARQEASESTTTFGAYRVYAPFESASNRQPQLPKGERTAGSALLSSGGGGQFHTCQITGCGNVCDDAYAALSRACTTHTTVGMVLLPVCAVCSFLDMFASKSRKHLSRIVYVLDFCCQRGSRVVLLYPAGEKGSSPHL